MQTMGKRRKRYRTRVASSQVCASTRTRVNFCDPSHGPIPATTSHLPCTSRRANSSDLKTTRPWAFLFHMLCSVALVGNSLEASQVDSYKVSSSPVILRSEQRQLFRGLHYRESELHHSAQDVISFLGIRYASAPIRRLRFMPPTPFNYASNQVHEARHFGPICMQRFPVDFNGEQRALLTDLLPAGGPAINESSAPAAKLRDAQLELIERLLARPSGRYRQLLELEQSEDCLNLNIHAPIEATTWDGLREPEVGNVERRRANPANLRPVLVVIHGDSFDYGAGSTISGARRFAAFNGLLVVTFNYRLNLLGFPPKLEGATGNTRTNLGLLDQVALLHWLQANIRSFGGAPRNVTLLGAGHGAVFVNLLMLSPLAKGLFQRAIVEGGTALSPTLANSFAQQQQLSWQHLRVLATIAGCSSNGTIDQHQPATRDASADELRRHFECLKSCKSDVLVQPIPFGLLDVAAGAPDELVLARRWHRPLELLLRSLLELDPSLVGTEARQSLNELANRIISSEEPTTGVQQLVQLTTSQLNRLIAQLVATRQLIGSQSGSSDPSTVQRVSDLLDELLGAIYLPSNETLIVHPFAPQLEPGTLLVRDELDLMSSMLQSQSPFGQQDLLIGSPKPLLDFSEQKLSYGDEALLEQTMDLRKQGATHLLPPPSELIHSNERFGAKVMHQTGLTNDQAILQVDLFVRSLFRYHQQEIANPIINDYFLTDQLASSSRMSHRTNSSTSSSDSSELARLKQIQLLDSLLSAYEDSLVNVPLVKTALVHSLKQLEALGDLFVSQQAYRLSELVRQADADVPKLLAEGQRKLAALEDDFLHFAQRLYNQTTMWPLDQLQSANQTWNEKQAHSTFFYQVESLNMLLLKIQSVIRKSEQKGLDEIQVSAKAISTIKTNLRDNLLMKFPDRSRFAQELSLGCSLFETHSLESEGVDLFAQLLSRICNRIGQQVVASFAISGNVNQLRKREELAGNTFASQLEQYEIECMQRDSLNKPDHHSVQPGGTMATSHLINSTLILVEPTTQLAPRPSCKRKLDELTLSYLMAELETSTKPERPRAWPVFNLFGQQLASVQAFNKPVWVTESMANSHGRARDHFDRKIAFWANFLPTLNCSRTQPLGANSLVQAQNSTLLNMNLNFNCHQGARTATSLLQSIQTRIKANLNEWIGAQLAKQEQQRLSIALVDTFSSQNHHSLRMATGNESQLDELNSETERQLNKSTAGWLPTEPASHKSALDGRLVSLFPSSASFFGVWLMGGAILVGSTLLAGGCALVSRLRHEHPKVSNRKRLFSGQSDDPVKARTNSIQAHSGELTSSNGLYSSQLAPPSSLPDKRHANNTGHEFPLEAQDSSSGRVDDPVEQQQETILLPIISTPHYFAAQPYQVSDTQYLPRCDPHEESSATNNSQSKQQQQPTQVLSSSSETTITNRAQSSVSLVSGSTNTTIPTNNDTNGSSRQAIKKRVQISDPKRLLETDYMFSHHAQQTGTQMYLDDQGQLTSQAHANGINLCPVHGASSSDYLLQKYSPFDYEASTAFLTKDSDGEAAFLEMVNGPPGVATIGSIADYLNVLTAHQTTQMATGDPFMCNSLPYGSQGSINKRRVMRQSSSGLCQMHKPDQTMGLR